MSHELDAAVGRAMGLEPTKAPGFHGHWMDVWPAFSTNMGQAWRVVLWMREKDFDFGSQWLAGETYACWFGPRVLNQQSDRWGDAEHTNPATAICLAFRAAMGDM